MLEHLFTWENWDQIDTFVFQYYGAVLKQSIGQFPKGFRPKSITTDLDAGTISIEGRKFKLKVSVC